MNSLIRTQPWLGTLVTIQLEAQAARAELLQWSQCAFAAIKATHLEFNLHCGQSELSWVNKVAAIGWATISAELMEILQLALQISTRSDGVFDICSIVNETKRGCASAPNWQQVELDLKRCRVRFHAPLRLDLSGIAKGYAVDQAARVLPKHCRYLINAGGDLRASHWQQQVVEIRLPENFPDSLSGNLPGHRLTPLKNPLQTVTMQNAALATSSDEVALRLVNPSTGSLCERSTWAYSVFADSCMLADALTKVLRLHPEPNRILAQFGAEGLISKPCGSPPKIEREQPALQCA